MDNEIHKFFSRINEEVEFIPPNTMFFINWFNQMPRFLKKKYYNQFGNSINFVSFLGFLSIESYNSHTKGRNLAFWNTASKVYDIHSIKRLYSYESRDFPIMLEGNILDPSFVLTYEMVKESLEKIYSPSKGSWKDKGMVAQGTFYKKLHEKSHITLKYNFNSCFYGHTIFLDNFEVLNKFKFYGTILVVNIGNNREKALFKQKSYSFDEILSYRFIALKLIKNSFKKEYTGCEKMFKRYSAPLRPKNHQYKEQLRKQKLVGILPLKLNSYEDTWDFLLTLNYDHLPIFNFLNDVTTQNTLINILKYGFPIFENVWKRNYFSLGFFHPCMILFKFVNKRMIPLFSFFFFDDNPNERIFKIVQNKSKTDSFEPNMLFVFLTMDVLKKRILSLSDEFRTLKNNWLIIIDVKKKKKRDFNTTAFMQAQPRRRRKLLRYKVNSNKKTAQEKKNKSLVSSLTGSRHKQKKKDEEQKKYSIEGFFKKLQQDAGNRRLERNNQLKIGKNNFNIEMETCCNNMDLFIRKGRDFNQEEEVIVFDQDLDEIDEDLVPRSNNETPSDNNSTTVRKEELDTGESVENSQDLPGNLVEDSQDLPTSDSEDGVIIIESVEGSCRKLKIRNDWEDCIIILEKCYDIEMIQDSYVWNWWIIDGNTGKYKDICLVGDDSKDKFGNLTKWKRKQKCIAILLGKDNLCFKENEIILMLEDNNKKFFDTGLAERRKDKYKSCTEEEILIDGISGFINKFDIIQKDFLDVRFPKNFLKNTNDEYLNIDIEYSKVVKNWKDKVETVIKMDVPKFSWFRKDKLEICSINKKCSKRISYDLIPLIDNWIDKNRFRVHNGLLFIQEIGNPSDYEIFQLKKYLDLRKLEALFNFGIDEKGKESNGTLLIWPKELAHSKKTIIISPVELNKRRDRIIIIKIENKYIINIYGPVLSKTCSFQQKTNWWKNNFKWLDNKIDSNWENTIILGDLNIKTSFQDYLNWQNRNNLRIDDYFNDEVMKRGLLNLEDTLKNNERKLTYREGSEWITCIDKIFVGININHNGIKYSGDNSCWSDHRMIRTIVNFNEELDKEEEDIKNNSFLNFEDPNINWFEINRTITNLFRKRNEFKDNYHLWYKNNLDMIKEVCKKNIPIRKSKNYKIDRKRIEISRLIVKANKTIRSLSDNNKGKTWFKKLNKNITLVGENIEWNKRFGQYLICRSNVVHFLDQIKNYLIWRVENLKEELNKWDKERTKEYFGIREKELEEALKANDYKILFRIINKKKKKVRINKVKTKEGITKNPKIVRKGVESQMDNLFENKRIEWGKRKRGEKWWKRDYFPHGNNVKRKNIFKEIDSYTFHKIISKLKNGKAPGIESVHNEILKNLDNENLEFIREYLNFCIRKGVLLNRWKTAKVTLIYKGKGEKSDPSNFRPISLCPTIQKILERVINYRMQIWLEDILSESQAGFRKNRDTKMLIYQVIAMLEDAKQHKKELYAMFIDFAKAYDSVPHDGLKDMLLGYGFNKDESNFLMEFVKGNKALFETEYGYTDPVKLERGLRQGSSLSPTLFIMFINPLLLWINDSKDGGYKMKNSHDGNKEKIKAFADDVLILAENLKDIKSMFSKIEEFANFYNMELNIGKNKTALMIRREDTEFNRAELENWSRISPISYNRKVTKKKNITTPITVLSWNECYKYLGIEISAHLDWSAQRRKTAKLIRIATRNLFYKNINNYMRALYVNATIIGILRYHAVFMKPGTIVEKAIKCVNWAYREHMGLKRLCFTPRFLEKNKSGHGEMEWKKEINMTIVNDLIRILNITDRNNPIKIRMNDIATKWKIGDGVWDNWEKDDTRGLFWSFIGRTREICKEFNIEIINKNQLDWNALMDTKFYTFYRKFKENEMHKILTNKEYKEDIIKIKGIGEKNLPEATTEIKETRKLIRKKREIERIVNIEQVKWKNRLLRKRERFRTMINSNSRIDTLYCFTDGSLIDDRAGCGIVILNHKGEILYSEESRIPNKQSVYRAELIGYAVLLEIIKGIDKDMEIFIDNKAVVGLINKMSVDNEWCFFFNKKEKSLLNYIYKLQKERNKFNDDKLLDFNVEWIKAHQDDISFIDNIKDIEIKGNRLADEYAKLGTEYSFEKCWTHLNDIELSEDEYLVIERRDNKKWFEPHKFCEDEVLNGSLMKSLRMKYRNETWIKFLNSFRGKVIEDSFCGEINNRFLFRLNKKLERFICLFRYNSLFTQSKLNEWENRERSCRLCNDIFIDKFHFLECDSNIEDRDEILEKLRIKIIKIDKKYLKSNRLDKLVIDSIKDPFNNIDIHLRESCFVKESEILKLITFKVEDKKLRFKIINKILKSIAYSIKEIYNKMTYKVIVEKENIKVMEDLYVEARIDGSIDSSEKYYYEDGKIWEKKVKIILEDYVRSLDKKKENIEKIGNDQVNSDLEESTPTAENLEEVDNDQVNSVLEEQITMEEDLEENINSQNDWMQLDYTSEPEPEYDFGELEEVNEINRKRSREFIERLEIGNNKRIKRRKKRVKGITRHLRTLRENITEDFS